MTDLYTTEYSSELRDDPYEDEQIALARAERQRQRERTNHILLAITIAFILAIILLTAYFGGSPQCSPTVYPYEGCGH